MPEIKNTFTQGKMNKDLDERIIPNGQYREAHNVKVSVSDDSDVGTVQNVLGNERLESIVPATYKCIGSISNEKTNKLYWFVTGGKDAILEYNLDTSETKLVLVDNKVNTQEAVLKFSEKIITGINIIDNLLFFTDGVNEPRKINIDSCIAGTTTVPDLDTATHTKLIINGVDEGDIKESHITVIRPNPKSQLDVIINEPITQTSKKLFEKIFPRFSYRYKYQDGEYSAFGPFTNVVFNASYDANYSSADAYSSVESYNTAMLNNIESVELKNFLTSNTPKDVVQVEILYKQEGTNVVFSIKKINYNSNDWNNNTCLVQSESIYAAVPENQLLRPFDTVPTKALAQEITGNRLIYGNYTQGYDPINANGFDIQEVFDNQYGGFGVDYIIRETNKSFTDGGVESVKSQRKYQVGFVLGDKYGRETPVFTSDDGYVEIPWYNFEKPEIGLSASQALQIVAKTPFNKDSVQISPPAWADYYKYYIKETSSEYYNLIMDKAYVPSRLNVYDNEEDHVWISFPSSDRSKINEEDYLILKKLVGASEDQVTIENKFKILDIANEAPDQIRFDYLPLGEATQTTAGVANFLSDNANGLMRDAAYRIDQETDMVYIHRGAWVNDCAGGSLTKDGDNENMYVDNIYMSFENRVDNEETSEKYKVVSIIFVNDNYRVKLNRKITEKDAQLADVNGVANDTTNALKSDLVLTFQRKEQKDLDEFSGKFFVKIVSSKPAVENIENNVALNLISKYIIVTKRPIRWYVESADGGNDPTAGIINGNYPTITFSNHDKLNTATVNGGFALTNTAVAWDNVMASNSDHSVGNADGSSKTFFIDNAYFVAGQIDENNYARQSGQTYRGSRIIYPTDASWGGASGWFFPVLSQYHNNFGAHSGLYDSKPFYNVTGGITETIAIDQDINSLEGYVQATGPSHIKPATGSYTDGYRVWLKGKIQERFDFDYSVYTEDTDGKHYLHISFLAPGVDLHGGWNSLGVTTSSPLVGPGSISDNLQGIWGGGIFAENGTTIEMEGNYNASLSAQIPPPAPGVGQGYDINYKEQHDNQWNPAYPENPTTNPNFEAIKEFVNQLKKGSKFKFSNDTNNNVIEIISDVSVKKLYNHTPWRAYKAWDGTGSGPFSSALALGGNSVEEAAVAWAQDTSDNVKLNTLKDRIENFGKASNRRVAYIFEINVDLTDVSTPILTDSDVIDSNGSATDGLADIEFLSNDPNVLIGKIKDVAAIWETEPKIDEGLDIYYEASSAYPFNVNEETSELLAPVGSRVEFLFDDANNGTVVIDRDNFIQSWINERTFEVTYGFNSKDVNGSVISYAGKRIRIFKEDGSFVTLQTSSHYLYPGSTPNNFYTAFTLDATINQGLEFGLSWNNCFSFGNGIESDRIRDDFNAPQIGNGVKASITLQQDYKEENRKSGLIFSGVYNSTSSVNNLNQFIIAENITKDLNPTYGSIQKLFQRRISLVAFCEDRVVSITSNKDSLFNADGNPQLISSTNVLGDATPFVGDYGISKNPESFAKESYRAYFTDKQRGAVLRLSMDGLTPISEAGMNDYFRDNLKLTDNLIGSYDNHNKYYNLTIAQPTPGSNLITNGTFSTGNPATVASNAELVTDGNVNNITPLTYPVIDNIADNIVLNQLLESQTDIINYDEIPQYSLLPETTSGSTTIVNNYTTFATGGFGNEYYAMALSGGVNPFDNNNNGQDNYIALHHFNSLTNYNVNNNFFAANMDLHQYPDYGGGQTDSSYTGDWWAGATNADFGASGDVFWNPTDTSYTGLYNGGIKSTGNPWFYDTSMNGIIIDGLGHTFGGFAMLPGDRDADGNANVSNLPNNVSTIYPNARDNTIFNGEEVRLLFYFKHPEDFDGTGPHDRNVVISLYDGAKTTGVAVNDVNLSPGDPNISGLTDPDYSTYHVTPTISDFQVGYQTTATYSFPVDSTGNNNLHEVYFKFTDGTEDESIVVQDLQFAIGVNAASGGAYGVIGSLNIRKVFRMETAYEETVLPGSPQGDGIPSVTVPAFAGVTHDIVDWETGALGVGFLGDHNAIEATSTYGVEHTPTLITETRQGQTISYNAPPGSYIDGSSNNLVPGNVSNGTVVYNDGSGGANMYVDGLTAAIDDAVALFNTEEYELIGESSISFVQDNWYVVDILFNSGTISNPGTNQISLSSNGVGLGAVDPIPVTYDDFYDAPTDVIRFLFQAPAGLSNMIELYFEDIGIEITQINLIDVTATYSGGNALNWSGGIQPGINYFSVPGVYADSNNGFVFTNQIGSLLFQPIANLTATTSGYRITFEISNYTAGKLSLYIANSTESLIYNDIDQDGVYTVDFNFDGNGGNVFLNGTQHGAFTSQGVQNANVIAFAPDDAIDFVGNLDNISLQDQTIYFVSGGSANSFNTSGFDPLLNNYIDYDNLNEAIVFNNAPASTPPVQLEQIIPNLATGDSYKLSFNYANITGSIEGYYFNSNGDGFRFIVPSGTGYFTQTFVIGDATINNSAGELSSTLVFAVAANSTSGSLDNVSMQQVSSGFEASTISYSERVRGWVSFKSFILEQGVSLSNNYYTFKNGGLWKHNSESVDRVTFYGIPYESSVTAIFNEAPSVIKNFNTLNYEGSQAQIENAYNYNQTVNGWYVDYIKTDKEEGSVLQFIEKEGKWFNYIKGKETTADNLDTSTLTFQGIGLAKSIV
jgi:hypothetical protein